MADEAYKGPKVYEYSSKEKRDMAIEKAQKKAAKESDKALDEIRKARLAQMKHQKEMSEHWRKQGHGVYREVESERTFFTDIEPHERTFCLLYENEADSVHDEL